MNYKRKKKPVKKLLFIALLLICLLPPAFAEEETVTCTSGDYEYILLEDGTAEITDYFGYAHELQIPSLLNEYTVTSIGNYAFYSCKSLTLTVDADSYAESYAEQEGIDYTYANALDWLYN